MTERKLRSFPSYLVLIYLGVQIVIGQIIAALPLDRHQWLNSFFTYVDFFSPTFRTWFVSSKDPIGCKLMLLLWWLIFIPWGLIWASRFTSGFKATDTKIFKSFWTKAKFLAIGLFFTALISYGHSFMDQSEGLASASLKYGRTSIVPFFINHGPEYFALYLAGMSLLYVVSSTILLMVLLDYFYQLKLFERNV